MKGQLRRCAEVKTVFRKREQIQQDWSGLGWLCSVDDLVISDECTYGYRQPCACVLLTWTGLSVIDPGASLTGWGMKKGGHGGEQRKYFFPPQLSIQRQRKFDMVDLDTFSIISKQEVSPAAVFWQGRGCSCNGQMLPIMFAFDFWPENKNWHYKCPMISSKLAWHSIAGPEGFLFVLCKWFCSCCCVLGLAIRTYWPFSGECGVLKRQWGRLEREWERAKRGPGCVLEYLCSLS